MVQGREVGEMGSIGSEEPAQWEKAEGGGTVGEEERILVSVRLRPLNAKELERNDTSDWECIDRTTVVFKNNLPDRSMYPTAYTFGECFPIALTLFSCFIVHSCSGNADENERILHVLNELDNVSEIYCI